MSVDVTVAFSCARRSDGSRGFALRGRSGLVCPGQTPPARGAGRLRRCRECGWLASVSMSACLSRGTLVLAFLCFLCHWPPWAGKGACSAPLSPARGCGELVSFLSWTFGGPHQCTCAWRLPVWEVINYWFSFSDRLLQVVSVILGEFWRPVPFGMCGSVSTPWGLRSHVSAVISGLVPPGPMATLATAVLSSFGCALGPTCGWSRRARLQAGACARCLLSGQVRRRAA